MKKEEELEEKSKKIVKGGFFLLYRRLKGIKLKGVFNIVIVISRGHRVLILLRLGLNGVVVK